MFMFVLSNFMQHPRKLYILYKVLYFRVYCMRVANIYKNTFIFKKNLKISNISIKNPQKSKKR